MQRSPQRLVVGLGNPGPEYAATRHNVGFRVIEALARRVGAGGERVADGDFVADGALHGRLARVRLAGLDCALLAPSTFMNRSGESVAAALARWPSLAPDSDLLIVYDDLDLPLGRLRLRPGGSAGGHRGMRDIARVVGSEAIPRLRFGIGHPGRADQVVDYVLEGFALEEEAEIVPGAVARAVEAVECWAGEGLVAAMGRFNGGV